MEAWKGKCMSSAYTFSFTPAMLVDTDRQSNLLDMTKNGCYGWLYPHISMEFKTPFGIENTP